MALVSHRGLFRDSFNTENTLETFKKASEFYKFVECDVRLTKDNVLVISHDPTLKRVSDKNSNKISEMTWSVIKDVPLKKGERVPRLIDLLRLSEKTGFKVLVELKTGSQKIGEVVAELLHKHKNLTKHVELVMSFSKNVLTGFFKKSKLDIPIVLLLENFEMKTNHNEQKLTKNKQSFNKYYVKFDKKMLNKKLNKEIIGIWGLGLDDNIETANKLFKNGALFVNTERIKDFST